MLYYFRYTIISILFIALQTTIIPFLSIGTIVPDILLIWLVYIALQKGQIPAIIFGFCIGLVIDLLSSHFLGLTALTKTLAAFCAGYFFNENKIDITVGRYQFLIITGIISFVHNIIYFVIFVQGSDVTILSAIFYFGLFSALYTVLIAVFPMLFFHRKLL